MTELQQLIVFCDRPLEGFYNFKDIIKIRPAFELEPKPPMMAKYPIKIEFNALLFDDAYDQKDWIEKAEINNDIVFELMTLFSVLTHYRFYHLSNRSSWFLPFTEDKFAKISIWGQESYFGKIIDGAEPVTEEIVKIPYNEYYGQYAKRLSTEAITFPDSIDKLLEKYFSLEPPIREVFKRVCILFHKGVTLKDLGMSHSFSFTAIVSCIEILVQYQHRYEKPESCPECGQLMYAVSRKFRDFMIEHGPTGEGYKKYVNEIYGMRSGILHRGNLFDTDIMDRLELMDSVEIEHLIRTIRICILNWYVKQ